MFAELIQTAYEFGSRHPAYRAGMSKAYRALRWANRFRHHAHRRINGVTFELDLSELIDGDLYFKGAFEPDTVSALETLAKPGDIVFDVGANIGCHALRLAHLVGPTGQVIAFEPMSRAYRKLQRNRDLNPQLRNLRLEHLAVSNSSAAGRPATFRTSWKVFGPQKRVTTETVAVVSLDDYVSRHRISRVDLVKIDVDGFEYKVISGATHALVELRPSLVMELGEYTLASVGDSLEMLVSLLHSLGYHIFDEKTRIRLTSYQDIAGSIPSDATINVVCLHDASLVTGHCCGVSNHK